MTTLAAIKTAESQAPKSIKAWWKTKNLSGTKQSQAFPNLTLGIDQCKILHYAIHMEPKALMSLLTASKCKMHRI